MAASQCADDDEWSVPCSDDEKYEISPDDMKQLFEKVARNEPLVLEWKCPGRRSPTPEPSVENQEVEEKIKIEVEPQQRLVANLLPMICWFVTNHFSGAGKALSAVCVCVCINDIFPSYLECSP